MNYLLDAGETFHYAALQIFGCLDPRALFRCRRVSHAFKKLSDQVIDARRIRSGKLFEQNRLLHGVPKHHGVWEMHNYSEPPSSIVCRDSWTLVTFPKNPQEEDPPNYQDMTLKEQLKVLLIVETENTEPLWHINFTHTRYRKSFAYLGEHVFFINEHIYVRLNYPLINTEAAYSFDGEICDVAESPGDDPNFLAVLAAGHALLVMVYYEGRVVPITRLNVVLPNAAMVFWTIHEIILVGEPTRYGMLEFHTYDSSFYSAQHEMDWQERYIPVAGGVHYTLLGVKKTPKRPGLVVVSNDSAGNYCICVIDLELRSSTLQFVETAGPVHLFAVSQHHVALAGLRGRLHVVHQKTQRRHFHPIGNVTAIHVSGDDFHVHSDQGLTGGQSLLFLIKPDLEFSCMTDWTVLGGVSPFQFPISIFPYSRRGPHPYTFLAFELSHGKTVGYVGHD